MNKSQLIEELSKRVGNDKAEIRYILEELNNIILRKREPAKRYVYRVSVFILPAYRQAGWLETRKAERL